MEPISLLYDKEGNTLDVWFVKPRKAICEEIGEDFIIKKDRKGNILGFEKLNYIKHPGKDIGELPIKVMVS